MIMLHTLLGNVLGPGKEPVQVRGPEAEVLLTSW